MILMLYDTGRTHHLVLHEIIAVFLNFMIAIILNNSVSYVSYNMSIM